MVQDDTKATVNRLTRYDYFPYLLDQFMVSKGALQSDSPIMVENFTDSSMAKIELFDEMVSGGDYREPLPFGRPSNGTYNPETGYSDHYPISMQLLEE